MPGVPLGDWKFIIWGLEVQPRPRVAWRSSFLDLRFRLCLVVGGKKWKGRVVLKEEKVK